MNIIRAQFIHQHKDEVVYEKEILLGSPALTQHYDNLKAHLEFDMPLLLDIKHEFIKRWVVSSRNCRVTRRVLRFADSDGTMLYELSERPLKANISIPENFDGDFLTIHICCIIEKDEVKELAKIFFPKYFAD